MQNFIEILEGKTFDRNDEILLKSITYDMISLMEQKIRRFMDNTGKKGKDIENMAKEYILKKLKDM